MRILGTEPSSVILSQIDKLKKLKSDAQKVPNQKFHLNEAINSDNENSFQDLCVHVKVIGSDIHTRVYN